MCFLRRNEGKYLPYRMNRLEYRMASFDDALAALAAKVDAVAAMFANDSTALEEARRAAAEAEARAAAVVADDAAQDAADDAARADALGAVSAKLDGLLNPPAPVELSDVADVPVEPVVVEDSPEGTPPVE